MILAATGLIVLGGVIAAMGHKLFRILLPLAGLITGIMVGFAGVQAVFGTGVVSSAVALVVSLLTGLLIGLLSFLFYHVAVVAMTAVVGSTALSYLGVAMGLEDNGFVLLLLGIAGAVFGIMFATMTPFSIDLIFTLTAFIGVAWILAGVLLLVGDVSVANLRENGIIPTIITTVDQSFLWLFAWLGGSIIASKLQRRVAIEEFLGNEYQFEERKV